MSLSSSVRNLSLFALLSAACTARPDTGDDGEWASLKAEIRERYPEVSQVSVEELEAWLARDERPILLDVRAPEEFGVSRLAGARLASDVEAALEVLGEAGPDRPVVLYCSVGYRSSDLAAKLAERGIPNLHNLEGSIFEWANSGRPVERDGEREGAAAPGVHPYDKEWGRLLDRELWEWPASR